MEVHRKHQDSTHGNRMMMMALTYAVRHRVPSLHLVNQQRVNAVDIYPMVFLPSMEDYSFLRSRLITMVGRVLSELIPQLHAIRDRVGAHIAHEKSHEMKRKSEVNISLFFV